MVENVLLESRLYGLDKDVRGSGSYRKISINFITPFGEYVTGLCCDQGLQYSLVVINDLWREEGRRTAAWYG